MSLRDALLDFRSPPRAGQMAVPKVVIAAAAVFKKYSPKVAPEPGDIDEILLRVAESAVSGTLATLDTADLKAAAAPLISGRRGLGGGLFLDYLTEIERRADKRLVRALLAPYLMEFDPNSIRTKAVAVFLRGRQSNLFKSWRRRIDTGHLLDVENGPSKAVRELMEADDLPAAKRKIGLWGAYEASGFMGQVLAEAGSTVSDQLVLGNKHESFERFLELLVPDDIIRPGNASDIALEHLILPFEMKPTGPEIDSVRATIQKLVVDSFGDPRINPGAWPGEADVRHRCVRIVSNWLVFDSIELFLQVIDQTAPASQWDRRRRLWQRFFEAELVTEAWVILAATPHRKALKIKRDKEKGESLAWGQLRGALHDQSVLLMRIGDIVVAEWSHSGKFRLWRKVNQSAPIFYQQQYTCPELRNGSNDEVVHLGDWVPRAELKIRNETGISV